jgi:hypothetical protein
MPDKKSPAASEGDNNPIDNDTRSAQNLTDYARQAREQWEADQAKKADSSKTTADDTTVPDNPAETADSSPQVGSTTHDLKKQAALALHMQFEKEQAERTPTDDDPAQSPPDSIDSDEVAQVATPAVNAVRLDITNQEPPLTVSLADELIIGRGDARTNYQPDVDLTPYGAYRMGISRRHARFVYADACLYLVDSGSRNGTAINGSTLTPKERYPLHDGDVLRFGNLQVTVHFVP